MVNITLFELHLEGAQFTANAPYSGGTAEGDESEIEIEGEDDEASGGFPFGLIAALSVFAAVASFLVAKKVLGGSETETATDSE